MKNTIVLKKVSLQIGTKDILKDITFSVKPNIPLSIIGTGSSGKSSLLKSILGLLYIKSGEILIDGVSIADTNMDKSLATYSHQRLQINSLVVTIKFVYVLPSSNP